MSLPTLRCAATGLLRRTVRSADARSGTIGLKRGLTTRQQMPEELFDQTLQDLPPLPELERWHRAPVLPVRAQTDAVMQFRTCMLDRRLNAAWSLYTTLYRADRLKELVAEDHSRLLYAIHTFVNQQIVRMGTATILKRRHKQLRQQRGQPRQQEMNEMLQGEQEQQLEASQSAVSQMMCGRVLNIIKCMHAYRIRPDMRDYQAAMNVLARFGSIDEVDQLWTRLTTSNLNRPGIALWNARLHAYIQAGMISKSFAIAHEMQQEGVMPNSTTYDMLIDLYSLTGNPSGSAQLLIQRLQMLGYEGFDALRSLDSTRPLIEGVATGSRLRAYFASETATSRKPDQLEGLFTSKRKKKRDQAAVEPQVALPCPTVHSFNRVMRAYRRAGHSEAVDSVYRTLTETLKVPAGAVHPHPNVGTLNEMLSAHYQADFALQRALQERIQSEHGINPDHYTYHLLIRAASNERLQWDQVELMWRTMCKENIQPLGMTCARILRRLKRSRFAEFRREVYTILQRELALFDGVSDPDEAIDWPV